jgi:hypothetical protein
MPQDYKDAYEYENDPDYHTADAGFEVVDMNEFIDTQIELEVIPPGTDWRDYANLVPLWRAQLANGLPLRPAIEDLK